MMQSQRLILKGMFSRSCGTRVTKTGGCFYSKGMPDPVLELVFLITCSVSVSDNKTFLGVIQQQLM